MKPALYRAVVFAGTSFFLLLVADLVFWGGYQGMHAREELQQQLVLRGAMHTAVLSLSLIGAIVAFSLLRHRLPASRTVLFFAAGFTVNTFFVVVTVFTVAGPLGAALWLLFGSALFAMLSAFTVKPHAG